VEYGCALWSKSVAIAKMIKRRDSAWKCSEELKDLGKQVYGMNQGGFGEVHSLGLVYSSKDLIIEFGSWYWRITFGGSRCGIYTWRIVTHMNFPYSE